MKIFYAVQATGNGHISRAISLLPYLQAYGTVDVFLSGNNYALKSDLPIAYRSKGLSLQYDVNTGGVDIWKTIVSANLRKVLNEAKCLPIDKYDLIINDFECITSLACQIKKVPSVQFGHQASFKSKLVPRPEKRELIGEWVLNNYARATKQLGLHFKCYDDFICEPIIKNAILEAQPKDQGHITVYLSHVSHEIQQKLFSDLRKYEFHVFSPAITQPYTDANIKFFPVNQEMFTHSMINSYGVITGAGFETPAETLYLGKKLMVIPLKGQYEQQCNAAALRDFNVPVIQNLDSYFPLHFNKWVFDTKVKKLNLTSTTEGIVQKLFDMQSNGKSTNSTFNPFKFEAAAF